MRRPLFSFTIPHQTPIKNFKGNSVNPTPKYLVLLTASALMLGGCDKLGSFFGDAKEKGSEFVQSIEAKTDGGSVGMLLPDFTKLVEQEGPSVVNIQATKNAPAASARNDGGMDLSQFPDNDPFYEFFKRLVPNMPEVPQQDDDGELNFGSGFIISPDGYILTNTHVVGGMNNIKVMLNDKREYTAKLIGSDQQSDVALLKIDAADLPVVKIGNAKDLKPGEWVAAIGAPFGFDNSVTAGIVSAKGRSLPNENYTPFIQTDVAINPGNSGGPLFNLKGQVVGINSQIYSRSGGFMGISFAIPIDVAMNVADQLRTTGKVQRGQLGVII
ncbi:MAG: trypsin-like peptidase domain-containing protein, partial [Neisseria sp.]|nr:trypsin-like peptidase domain-containing protein [Neisseria sp.]MBP8043952.1 trypsin-like peptidase domain-containing protein [Neisseria sp.]